MLRRALCVLVFASLSAIAALGADDQGRVYREGGLTISLSADGERLTVSAKEVSRRKVFSVLASVFGVEVRPVDKADETISAEISERPLEAAIAQLLPAASRFVVRTERERTVVGEEGTKKGVPAESTTRPQKTEGPPGPVPKGAQKGAPTAAPPVTDRVVEGGKPASKSSAGVPEAKGAKAPKAAEPVLQEAVRLSFILRSTGEVVLTHARAVEGKIPESTEAVGNFAFLVRDATGTVRYLESLNNPLSQHSYRTDGTHDETRAREALFGVWIPKALLEREGRGLRLQFFDKVDSATLQKGGPEAARTLEAAKPLAELKGEEVLRALEGGVK